MFKWVKNIFKRKKKPTKKTQVRPHRPIELPDGVKCLVSQKGIDMIARFEGFRSQAYRCSAGRWTVGYGTTRYPDGTPVKRGDMITEKNAKVLMYDDINDHIRPAMEYAEAHGLEYTEDQWSALASFSYNLGAYKLIGGSKIAIAFKANDLMGVYKGLMNHVYVKKWGIPRKLQGLVNRRRAEQELFGKPTKKILLGKNDDEALDHRGFLVIADDVDHFSMATEALSQVGKLYETSKNWSTNLDAYLSGTTNFKRGHPWCQYFQNAVGIKVLGDKWPHGKGGSTQKDFREAKRKGYVIDKPKVGCQAYYQDITNKSYGHVEMVVGLKSDTEVYTVGGNVGNKCKLLVRSSIEGYEGKRLLGYVDFKKPQA